jgi:2,4-dienoyl-CoA reductase-like NADH-dependent reductase (Old Yellow Enzyme family)
MEGCDGTLDGRPGELTFKRWEAFGAGGAKIIWGEATAVVPEGRANPRQLLLTTRRQAASKSCWNARVGAPGQIGNDNDLVVGLHLTHSGAGAMPSNDRPA